MPPATLVIPSVTTVTTDHDRLFEMQREGQYAMSSDSSAPGLAIRRLHNVSDAELEQLADVLIDCVAGGASVSFMHPLTRGRAVSFWQGIMRDLATEARLLFVAEDAHGICGTVQLVFDMPDNQPHRGDLTKLLVHRRARRHGVGAALMKTAEASARNRGKTLLVLDCATGCDAERLYEQLGWTRVGVIPDYSLLPHGQLCGTTVFFRPLIGPPPCASSEGKSEP
jgi:GNAT superfamily N-acetyltransferase